MKRRSHTSDEGWLLSYADLITNLLIFFAMMLAAAQPSRARMQQMAEALSGKEQPESLHHIEDQIQKKIEERGLEDMVSTDLTDEGLKLALNSGLVFASGSAQIRPEQATTLDGMLETLVPYSGRYDFAVEGHTDSTPLMGDNARTNWELSAERANAVRTRLEQVGIDRSRIRVEGYADTVPLPVDELTGLSEAEALARHRRVVVRIF